MTTNAQDSLTQVKDKSLYKFENQYGLIITYNNDSIVTQDTLLYDLKSQSFSNKNGQSSDYFLQRTRSARFFGGYIATLQLSENVLVVMLRTNHKQLRQLRILSRDPSFSEIQRQNVLDKITNIEKEVKIINNGIMAGFSNHYNFSDVYFMYDSSLTSLKNGITKGIFVDKYGKIDKNIELHSTNFYICNYTLANTSNQSEGLVVYNSDMDRVKRPFPSVSVSSSSGFNMLLKLLTSNNNYYRKKIEKDVVELQENLGRLLARGNNRFNLN